MTENKRKTGRKLPKQPNQNYSKLVAHVNSGKKELMANML